MLELPREVEICRYVDEYVFIKYMVKEGCDWLSNGNCGIDNKPCDARKAVLNWAEEE